MLFSMIVVNYYSEKQIENLLRLLCIEKHTDNFEVIVVSNSGVITSPPILRYCRVLYPDTNCGYARACNLGAKSGNTDILVFCNPDIHSTFAQIKELVDITKRNESIGLLSIDTSNSLGKASNVTIQNTSDKLIGCLYVFRRSVFEGLSGWDENFFLWGEDTDLCLRVRKLNLSTSVAQNSGITHDAGVTWRTNKLEKNILYTRVWLSSQTYLQLKHAGIQAARKYLAKQIMIELVRVVARKKPLGRAHHSLTHLKFCTFLLLKGTSIEDWVKFNGEKYKWQAV